MSNQLLPCPFCGGPAKAAEAYIRGDQAFAHIHCENHCEVAPSAGASSALFYWSDLRKKNVRIHSDDKAKLEATELAHAKWNRRATQPAAGEPVEAKEIGEMTITLRDGVKCFSFEEYSEAYKLPEGLHYLYTAPPAAAPVAAGEPVAPIGYANPKHLARMAAGEMGSVSVLAERSPDQNHTAPVFAAPPAAAHVADGEQAEPGEVGRAEFEAECRKQHRDITRNDVRGFEWGYLNHLTHDRWCGFNMAVRCMGLDRAPPAAAHGDEVVLWEMLEQLRTATDRQALPGEFIRVMWEAGCDWINARDSMRAQGEGEVQ